MRKNGPRLILQSMEETEKAPEGFQMREVTSLDAKVSDSRSKCFRFGGIREGIEWGQERGGYGRRG
jgi:hypothetical protein